MSQVRVAQAGAANQPSPSIWKDCPGERLVRDGTGYYFHEDFLGGATGAFATAITGVGGHFSLTTVGAATVLAFKAGEIGGWVDLETDGSDNDAWAIHTEPMVKIVLNSGQKVWLETFMEVGDADGDQGFFFGFAEEAALSAAMVADDAGALIGESYFGFRILTGEDAIDFAFKLDGGTEVVVSSDVTNNSLVPSNAVLADATPVKLGMRFDGRETLQIFVNGTKIAELPLTALFPVSVNLGAVMSFQTVSSSGGSAAIDWIRAGYQAIV